MHEDAAHEEEVDLNVADPNDPQPEATDNNLHGPDEAYLSRDEIDDIFTEVTANE